MLQIFWIAWKPQWGALAINRRRPSARGVAWKPGRADRPAGPRSAAVGGVATPIVSLPGPRAPHLPFFDPAAGRQEARNPTRELGQSRKSHAVQRVARDKSGQDQRECRRGGQSCSLRGRGKVRRKRRSIIPTNPNCYCLPMRERTGNLSEWALNLLVWPKTLNQRVQGSSPCAPTKDFNHLGAHRRRQGSRSLQSVCSFVLVSSFMIAISASFTSRPR